MGDRPLTKPSVENELSLVTSFVEIFQHRKMSELIGGLTTEIRQFDLGDISFPLTSNAQPVVNNCYLCSPITAFIDYSIEETRNLISSPVIKTMVSHLIKLSAPIVRMSRLDEQVQINNWLFSTNPVPSLSQDQLSELISKLGSSYPDQVIILRSLNEIADAEMIDLTRSSGFKLVATRQVYIFEGKSKSTNRSRDTQRDEKLLKTTRFEHVYNNQISDDDYPKIEKLYNKLYLEKYTPLNPNYRASLIRELHQKNIIELEGLRDRNSGDLVGISGFFKNGNTLTQPIVGYDTDLPQTDGIYRILMAMGRERALKDGLFFNMSAGAAEFKRNRGGMPAIEFTAIYDQHLSFTRRIATSFMGFMLNNIGIPLIKRFEL